MNRVFILLFVLLCGTFSAFSQAKKPAPPIIEIDATTNDGKAVILKSDGTWIFNPNAKTISSSKEPTLNIEAAIVYRSGEVVPISRTKFYLLAESAENILVTPELRSLLVADAAKNSEYLAKTAREGSLKDFLSSLRYPALYPSFSPAAIIAIEKAQKVVATSDFTGKSAISAPIGNYYLFVIAQTRKGFVAWNLPVAITNEGGNVVLDQNNAVVAY